MHQRKESIDTRAFEKHLKTETHLLKTWFLKNHLRSTCFRAGAEVEFLLLDNKLDLKPSNLDFVKQLNEPLVIPEAGASQLEINTKAQVLSGDFLANLHQQLRQKWQHCMQLAEESKAQILLMGSFPDRQERYEITDDPQYWWMDEKAKFYRQGQPIAIAFDDLLFKSSTLAIEGVICSFQLHLEVTQEKAPFFYEMIQTLSAPLTALCSNAPFFQNQPCWSESRIRLFEQIYTFPTPLSNNVFWESRNVGSSLFSLFSYNLENYPRLFPQVDLHAFPEEMKHLRYQNSCIYRWNRPILDFNEEGEPYLRIEHRPLPAGPSLIDMVANAAFYYGLVAYFNKEKTLPRLNSMEIKANFYEAAKNGLFAIFNWNKKKIEATELLAFFLPLAKKGLEYLDIDKADIQLYLNVIKMRLAKRQNGSVWQQNFIKKYSNDFKGMLKHYLDYQNRDIPIAEWNVLF